MDCRKKLIIALTHGDIPGNEEEIAEGLLTCDNDELDVFKKAAFFPQVIAAVWRNKEVMSHLNKSTTLSIFLCLEIMKHVEFTHAESIIIVNSVVKRQNITDSYVVNNMIHTEYKALITASEEIWKKVFVRD